MVLPQRNREQSLTVIDLTAQLAHQLSDFFYQFIPVTGQSKTTTVINPMLRPTTANSNHSSSTQSQLQVTELQLPPPKSQSLAVNPS